MVALENESKFRVLKNRKSLEIEIPSLISSLGFDFTTDEISHVDVYLDNNLELYRAGYSLRQRFRGGLLGCITLKTLKTLDSEGHLRVEEEGSTFKEVLEKVGKKLRSIFQNPSDEKAIDILSKIESLRPVIILTKSRLNFKINQNKHVGCLSLDNYSYLLPKVFENITELEIEGGSFLDQLRQLVINKFSKGRNPTIGLSDKSKFETGLTLGGIV